MKIEAIVLAAGKGTRMKSNYPKVLQDILGKPMLHWVTDSLQDANVDDIYVVVGHLREMVEKSIEGIGTPIYQAEQHGTGHAVATALNGMDKDGDLVIVTCGDTPLIKSETIRHFITYHQENKLDLSLLSANIENPTGYGRIVRSNGMVQAIVEEKDTTPEEKAICEINAGTYIFNKSFLLEFIDSLNNDNAQNEYYLTDLVGIALKNQKQVGAFLLDDHHESLGVNDRVQLSQATRILQERINHHWMLEGVSIPYPDQVVIGPNVSLSKDVFIEANTTILGNTSIGEDTTLTSGTYILNGKIGSGNLITHSHIWDAEVGNHCKIGPFAYLRPGTKLNDHIKIGDFVEVKNSNIGNGTKIPHLSYIGDSTVGEKVNIGCGTITCNYDGKEKHRTIIHDRVFVGSNVNLVAPVEIGSDASIGAGSTITKNVSEKSLAIERSDQKEIKDWKKKKH